MPGATDHAADVAHASKHGVECLFGCNSNSRTRIKWRSTGRLRFCGTYRIRPRRNERALCVQCAPASFRWMTSASAICPAISTRYSRSGRGSSSGLNAARKCAAGPVTRCKGIEHVNLAPPPACDRPSGAFHDRRACRDRRKFPLGINGDARPRPVQQIRDDQTHPLPCPAPRHRQNMPVIPTPGIAARQSRPDQEPAFLPRSQSVMCLYAGRPIGIRRGAILVPSGPPRGKSPAASALSAVALAFAGTEADAALPYPSNSRKVMTPPFQSRAEARLRAPFAAPSRAANPVTPPWRRPHRAISPAPQACARGPAKPLLNRSATLGF